MEFWTQNYHNHYHSTLSFFSTWQLTFSEHWMSFFFIFVFLMTDLSYMFLLDAYIFTITDESKEEKINFSSIFEAFYLNLRRKF